MSPPDANRPEPWYRQFWPWFLIALPLTAVVGSMITIYLATTRSHSMVVDDYARIGLSTQLRLERDQQARALGLTARLELTDGAVLASLRGDLQEMPDMLFLTLSHPTQASKDRRIELTSDGVAYRGRLELPPSNRWYVQLEPADLSWRLAGESRAGEGPLELRPPSSAVDDDP
jgi:hypothetical protein